MYLNVLMTILGPLKLVNKCSFSPHLHRPALQRFPPSTPKSPGEETEELLLSFCSFGKSFSVAGSLVPARKSLAHTLKWG